MTLTLTATAAAALIKASEDADRSAVEAFITSATSLARTLASGVTVADVKREAITLGVRTYRSNAALGYHALTGSVLLLPGTRGEYATCPKNVQTLVAALYQAKGGSRTVREIIDLSDSFMSAMGALIAAREAQMLAEITAAAAPVVRNVEGTDASTDEMEPSESTTDADALLRSLAGVAAKLSTMEATPGQRHSAEMIIANIQKFATTAGSVPATGDSPVRQSGRITRQRSPRAFSPVVTTAVA